MTASGYHFWNEFSNGCARRANLAQERDRDNLGSFDMAVGTCTHAMLEAFFDGNEFNSEPYPEDVLEESQRLMDAYCNGNQDARYEFGTVLHTELELPRNGQEAEALAGALISPYTAMLDLVVELDEAACAGLETTRGIHVEPGVWIVDHKTTKAWRPAGYRNSLQLLCYQKAWNVLNPDRKAKGAIVNGLVRTKEPRVETLVLPPIGPWEEEVLTAFFAKCNVVRLEPSLRDAVNTNQCYSWGRECEFLSNGQCKRY